MTHVCVQCNEAEAGCVSLMDAESSLDVYLSPQVTTTPFRRRDVGGVTASRVDALRRRGVEGMLSERRGVKGSIKGFC